MTDRLQIFDSSWNIPQGAIAIVGNGPVGVESEVEIYKANYVIRFNNWSNRGGIDQTHRGIRCDMLVTHFDCLPEKNRQPTSVLHAIPAPFQLRRNQRIAKNYYPACNHLMINPFWQANLCDELDLGRGTAVDGYKHPLPTVGFTLLWHLHRIATMQGRSITPYVAGFDWHFDPQAGTYEGLLPKSSAWPARNHYYVKEAAWVAQNLKWKFAPPAERALSWMRSLS